MNPTDSTAEWLSSSNCTYPHTIKLRASINSQMTEAQFERTAVHRRRRVLRHKEEFEQEQHSTETTKTPQVISEAASSENYEQPKKYGLRSTVAENIDWRHANEQTLNELSVERLRKELKSRGLPFTGTRHTLIDRLLTHVKQQQQQQAVEEEDEDVTSPAGGETQSSDSSVDSYHQVKVEKQAPPVPAKVEDVKDENQDSTNASLWPSEQLKNALKNLGYPAVGKRSTLLRRYNSVMHSINKKMKQQDDDLNQFDSTPEKEPEMSESPVEEKSSKEEENHSVAQSTRTQKRRRKEVVVLEKEIGPGQKRQRLQKTELTLDDKSRIEKEISEYESIFIMDNSDRWINQSSNLIDEEVVENHRSALKRSTIDWLNQYNCSQQVPDEEKLLSKVVNASEGLSAICIARDNTRLLHSLSGVEIFSHLRRFVCVEQRITDMSPLTSCLNLEEIFLSHNYIVSVPSLKNLKKLSAISLSFNHIHDISGLSGCSQLEYVNLSFNSYISDIRALSDCSQLVELDLSGNCLDSRSVSQFDSFSCSLTLSSLRLAFNQISSLRPIATRFPNLMELNLSNNSLFDISPLIRLRKLNELDLSNNNDLVKSIEVYLNGYTEQQNLQLEKLKGTTPSKKRSSRKHFIISSTEIAAEGNKESLLTGSIYDLIDGESEQCEHDEHHLWLHFGKVNNEVLECLTHLGARCVVRKL